MTTNSPGISALTTKSQQDLARSELAAWLKLARERSGLSVEAISQETRISKSYIVSLETGKLEALPGKVFGRGFVKNITRLLKSDTNEGLKLYDACWGDFGERPSEKPNSAAVKIETQAQPVNQTRPTEQIAPASLSTKWPAEQAAQPAFEGFDLPENAKSKITGPRFRMPMWMIRGVVSPQVRIWVLGGIATIFVALVFGRWAAANKHKLRFAERSSIATSSISGQSTQKSLDTSNKSESTTPSTVASNMDANAGVVDGMTEIERSPPSSNYAQATLAREQTSIADDENPLYLPSSIAAFEQVIELKVASDVEMKLTLDGKKLDQSNFSANSYRYTFNDRAEIYISDASHVDLIYNGKSLGTLGNKGRKRRIMLQAKASSSDFPQ